MSNFSVWQTESAVFSSCSFIITIITIQLPVFLQFKNDSRGPALELTQVSALALLASVPFSFVLRL